MEYNVTIGNSSRWLNLAALLKNTRMVGPGWRDAIWVQGCRICCPGCMNQAYQPHVKRVLTPVARLIAHFSARTDKISGCSILGGEPTEQAEAVADLLEGVQSLGLSTVVFTGRCLDELQLDPRYARLLAFTDVLIDGPFIAELYQPDLHWRGSTNQQFHLLSQRYSPADMAPDGANLELSLSESGVMFHGVGLTARLDQFSPHNPGGAPYPHFIQGGNHEHL